MAPPYRRSFSVSVVLPASGWLMMAKVRRRATSMGRRSRQLSVLTARRSSQDLPRSAAEPRIHHGAEDRPEGVAEPDPHVVAVVRRERPAVEEDFLRRRI